jgi:hypothetical protein
MPDFSNCSSGCTIGGHANWGECVRAKNSRVAWAGGTLTGYDATADKRWYSRIAEYRAASKQGIRPDSTRLQDIRRAVDISNKTGKAYITPR